MPSSIDLLANPSESDFVLIWAVLLLSNSFLNADSYACKASVIMYLSQLVQSTAIPSPIAAARAWKPDQSATTALE